jgi:hypothetical protein
MDAAENSSQRVRRMATRPLTPETTMARDHITTTPVNSEHSDDHPRNRKPLGDTDGNLGRFLPQDKDSKHVSVSAFNSSI